MGNAGDKRTYADRREHLIGAVRRRRHAIRTKSTEHKGSKCAVCGYDKCIEALEFHHLGSSEKDFGLSEKGYTRSWKRVKEELNKCILLCANCHREAHADKLQLSRVTGIEKPGELREA